MKQLLLFLAAILAVGCDAGMTGDQQAMDAAEDWAEAYFNCDFKEACEHVTPESEKWLRFAASNTTEQDLKLLQEAGGAEVSVNEGFEEANDTMRLVTLTVTNCLTAKPALAKEATFKVVVVKRDADWLVRMEGLPQNGMQSRD